MESIAESIASQDNLYLLNDYDFEIFNKLSLEREIYINYIIADPIQNKNQINMLLKKYEILLVNFMHEHKSTQQLVNSIFAIRMLRIFSCDFVQPIFKELSTALFDYLALTNHDLSLNDAISVGNYSKALEKMQSSGISIDKKQYFDNFRSLINILATSQTQNYSHSELTNILSNIKENAGKIIESTANFQECDIIRSCAQIIKEPEKANNAFAIIYSNAFFKTSCKLNSSVCQTPMENVASALFNKNYDQVSSYIVHLRTETLLPILYMRVNC